MKLLPYLAFVFVFFSTLFTSCSTYKKGVINKRIYTSSTSSKLPYQLFYPSYKGDNRLPLIVFLHGSGERGNDNIKQGIHVVPYLMSDEVQNVNPCIVLAPQCPEGEDWSPVDRSTWSPISDAAATEPMNNLISLIKKLKENKQVDPNRIYIIGLSMGGFGTFDLLSREPLLFAAGTPICGGGDLKVISNYASVPLWIFHGDKDEAVPVKRSREAYEAFKSVGGTAKYTEYVNAGHGIWENAVRESGYIDWLFSQYRGKGMR